MRIITEPEFAERMRELEGYIAGKLAVDFVTGPGRSGAIAAVYASHLLSLPFVPYKHIPPGRILIVDTARESGATLRKADAWYVRHGYDPVIWVAFEEPPRVAFWYEAAKPQRYRHEGIAA